MNAPPNCKQNCEVPEGVELVEMPPSRHAWSDIIRCPNDDCGRTYMIVKRPFAPAETGTEQP